MGLLEKVVIGLSKELGDELSAPMNVESSSPTASFSLSERKKLVPFESIKSGKAPPSLVSQESSQIVQVSPLPLSLNLSEYQNAYSNANPEGDMFAAKKFQQLVDTAPDLNHEYMTSVSSIEKLYGLIVNGASYQKENTFLASMIADAKYSFETSGLAEFVGHGEWRLVETVPYDWYMDKKTRYKKVKIALDGNGKDTSGLGLLGGKSSPTTLTLGDKKVSLSKATYFTHCELEYMLVRFVRPWMEFTLFETDGWWLSGQQPGYCSSGRSDKNSGILPLITNGMILVRSAKFEGDWDPEDQKKIDDIRKTNKDVYVGPYRLSNNSESVSRVNIAAWISELVPLSPRVDGTSVASSLNFSNEGQFKAMCIVMWNLDGKPIKTKAVITSGNADTIKVPGKETNILVIIRAVKGGKKKLAFKKKYPTLKNRSYVVSGTFETIKVNEV